VVLYLALIFAGGTITTSVALEKSSRISEVLLAVLRPTQALTGTVVAVGVLTLLQLLMLAGPVIVSQAISDSLDLPTAAAGDIVLAIVWFLLGFTLYSFVFAAAGSLVDKITEANSVMMPITMALVVVYLLGLMVVLPDPTGPAAVALSLFPLSAPIAMPLRWASGQVPVYQLVLAMLLTAAAAVVLARVAASLYARALLITGRRAKIREVLRPEPSPVEPARV
jgi:ABC-2 type transport system permease protein